MTLQSVLDAAASISSSDTAQRSFASAMVGEALDRELADPRVLAQTALKVAAAAEELGCHALIGASPVGERLASAAVALGANGLHLYLQGQPDDVLVVDGILVTGAQISDTVRRIRAEGALHPSAAVVVAVNPVDMGNVVDRLVVLS